MFFLHFLTGHLWGGRAAVRLEAVDGVTEGYLVLFLVGSGFAVVSWGLGALGLAHGHAPGGGHGHGAAGAHHAGGSSGHADATTLSGVLGKLLLPVANPSAAAALACVAGAAGFVARRGGASVIASLALSVPLGLTAAYAVGALTGWLLRGTRYARPLPLGSTFGKVLAFIGEDRTGEIIYTQNGARHAIAARSATGRPIEAGTEIVVVDIQDGVATVTPASDVLGVEERNEHEH